MVQPVEGARSGGLVFSVPVLAEAGVAGRHGPELQERLRAAVEGTPPRIRDLPRLLASLFSLTPDLFDAGDALPKDLQVWIPEGRLYLRPTLALKKQSTDDSASTASGDNAAKPETPTPEQSAGRAYVMLVAEIEGGASLERGELQVGPAAQFDRLLRICRVPIGLLSNGETLRLIYAPHGQASGHIDFRIADLCGAAIGGRLVLDALVNLLSAQRFFGVSKERQLPALLEKSRAYQATVTNRLADQVFEALEILLDGFADAAVRDRSQLLDEVVAAEGDKAYGGLLTVLLRLVFLLYAEERGLMPVGHPYYKQHLSVLSLFTKLQEEAGTYPDTMSRRFGAWPRLVALFRAVYEGIHHGDLRMPARGGELFDPDRYEFLEGREQQTSVHKHRARSEVRLPTVDDETIYRVLDKLIVLDGQRLSYGTLEVEQIGSVYEALMGYHVRKLADTAVCLRPAHVWVSLSPLLGSPSNERPLVLESETGLDRASIKKVAAELKQAKRQEDVLASLEPLRASKHTLGRAGQLILQPGAERRRTSSHYTPRDLCERIVSRTLEPILAVMGENPAADRLLDLKICDPAMGSGAFLVAACRYLAKQVEAAWAREGKSAEMQLQAAGDTVFNYAARIVAQRCLYGVDKNPFAVNLAKLSLWLTTLAKDEPFTFVDHTLRHGDALVGLTFEQIQSLHWKPDPQVNLCQAEVNAALDEALAARKAILDLATKTGTAFSKQRTKLLKDAEDATKRARNLADLVIGAWFENDSDRSRKAELEKRRDLVLASVLGPGASLPDDVSVMADRVRRKVAPFHWMIEFPEIFQAERRDPLDADGRPAVVWMDAFVGNPPFSGKNGITETSGPAYLPWLLESHPGSHGNADLAAHFFRRTSFLLGDHGAVGLVASNTIGQGDTRATGLGILLRQGAKIYDATSSMEWPGDASVSVSVVILAQGKVAKCPTIRPRLDNSYCSNISSRLRPTPERADPAVLRSNAGRCYVGSYVLGMGFILTPEEREDLVQRNPVNAECIFPYLGGEEVNTSPTQEFHRYVINFGNRPLEDCLAWKDLINIVREKVKPERATNNRAMYREHWWQFGEKRAELSVAIVPKERYWIDSTALLLSEIPKVIGQCRVTQESGSAYRPLPPRCLVASQVSKHLVFAWQPTGHVFAHTLNVFPFMRSSDFSVMQSRIHEIWARLLGSSLEDRLRYASSDCFDTFPFPSRSQTSLASRGEKLDQARSTFMKDTQQGLTITYNLLKDPDCTDPRVLELRKLHEEVDAAVLAAYRWSDIKVPSYLPPSTPEEKKAWSAFEDEVIDRLFALNAERAAEEAKRPPREHFAIQWDAGEAGQTAPTDENHPVPIETKRKGPKRAASKTDHSEVHTDEPPARAKGGRR